MRACCGSSRDGTGGGAGVPLLGGQPVRAILTAWLAGEPLPEGLALGDECQLKDPVDGGAVVALRRHEMAVDEVRKHLEAGKQCTRLGLVLYDHVSFVLGEDLTVRKLKFLDGAIEPLENTERDSLGEELAARFAIMSGEVGRLFGVLEQALKLSKVEG